MIGRTHYESQFETELTLERWRLPRAYQEALVRQGWGGEPDDLEVVPVDVWYQPGWHRPAQLGGHPDTWCPAEGEAAEIVWIETQLERQEFPVAILGYAELVELEGRAWQDQEIDQ